MTTPPRLFLLAALLAAGPSLAQQDPAPPPPPAEAPAGLFEATVTAARRREVLLDSPRAASVIDRDELDRRQVRTTPEALLEEPGVWVQRTNYGGGALFVRGLFGNRVLLLVDGVRLNNSTFRAGPNQFLNTVDPLLIERIEVVRGTGSALYGSDALGAAVNVLTAQPVLGGDKPLSAALRLGGSSADSSGAAGLKASWSGKDAGLLVSGHLRRFGELRGGADTGVQHFTGYDEWSASAAATWRLAPGHLLSASFQSTRQFDVPRTDRSTPADLRLFTLQDRQLGWLRWATEGPLGPFTAVRATASLHRQREIADRLRVARDAQERDDNRVGTLGLQLDGELPFLGGPLVLGAESYTDFVKSGAARGTLSTQGSLTGRPELARYGEGVGTTSAALFAGWKLPLHPLLSLSAEGRVGLVRIDLPEDRRLSLLFPAAGLAALPAQTDLVPVTAGSLWAHLTPLPQVAVNAGLSLGFRAPNLDDQSRLGVEGASYILPTRGLVAEKALSGEAGVKAAHRGFEAQVTYAYTYIFDAIGKEAATIDGQTVLDGQRVARLVNTDSARYVAWEAQGKAPLWRRLSLFANLAWAFGTVERSVPGAAAGAPATVIKEPAEKVPPLSGKAGLAWRAPEGKWFVEGLVRWALRQDRLGEADLGDVRICAQVPGACTGTPGWATLGVRGGADLFGKARLTLSLENLLDTSYRMHGSGIDGPGRSVQALLEGKL